MSESTQHPKRAFLATCPRGLEELLVEELHLLGVATHKATVAGVHFHGSLEVAYRACLWSRLANRIVLCLLREEGIEQPEALHNAVASVEWVQHLSPGATLAVDFHGRSEQIRHTRFGAQIVKDGVVDVIQAADRERPSVDLQRPDLRLYAHLHRGRLTLGVDLSGDSLHRRGYRRDVGHAPLKENLAAALLMRAGWLQRLRNGETLVDPLCGAGTLLIEAALMAADMAPNLSRVRFGFHGWAQHDEALWTELKREAEARASIGRKRCRNRFYGFDESPPALAAAKSNAMRAGIPALIEFRGAALGQLQRPEELDADTLGLVMANPPYGERLGELPELVTLYQELGEGVQRAFPGWRLAVFTANPDLGHRIGLRADKQYSLKNGPLEAKLLLLNVPDEAPGGEGAGVTPPARSEGAQMFANRLEKNRKRLRKWLKQTGETCYRLYDADMPEYALAVDVYDSRVHVQEYAPPRSINAAQAQKRLFDALQVIPEVLDIDPAQLVVKRRERQGGKAQYGKQASTGERFQVQEGRARLWVNLRDYLDTGLFLDHRPGRRLP